MITNFKIFEKTRFDDLFEEVSYYVIYGNLAVAIDVLKTINESIKNIFLSILIEDLQRMVDFYINTICTFIYINRDGFQYYAFNSEKEKEKIINDPITLDYKFKGEIKKVNGEIVIDKLEVDTKKYNL